jgi:polar amino acid transport system ATP-binding protein
MSASPDYGLPDTDSTVGGLVPAVGRGGAAPVLRLESVRKRYGDHEVLRGVSLDLRPHESLVIIGPSGSGKSTLLRCMNMLEVPDSGSVWFEGADLTDVRVNLNKARARIGIVFQAYNLFPHRTAAGNITLALRKVLRLGAEEARSRAMAELDRVGLAHKADSYPGQLSGGQQQRVAIARALAMHPRVLLFDEVTSALDPELVNEVLAVMRSLAAEGMTMAVVTHAMGFARDAGTRMAFIDDGQVLEEGDPAQLLADPQAERLRRFLSQINQ